MKILSEREMYHVIFLRQMDVSDPCNHVSSRMVCFDPFFVKIRPFQKKTLVPTLNPVEICTSSETRKWVGEGLGDEVA